MRSHFALTLVALGCLFTAPVLAQQHHAAGPLSDEELIKSAESAAPMAIAKEATNDPPPLKWSDLNSLT